MNRVLKVVFSRVKGMFVVVSELGRACTKGSLKSVLVAVPMTLLATNAVATGNFIASDVNGIAIGVEGVQTEDQPKVKNTADIAIGTQASANYSGSVAVGQSSTAKNGSVAIGAKASATSDNTQTSSVALGYGATATVDGSVALGAGSVANDRDTVSVGSSSNTRRIVNVTDGVKANDASTVGQVSQAFDSLESILGKDVNVEYDQDGKFSISFEGTGQATIFGAIETVSSDVSTLNNTVRNHTDKLKYIAFGLPQGATDAKASGINTLAIGYGAEAESVAAVAVGNGTHAAESAVAMGGYATANGSYSVALGYGSTTSAENTVSVGHLNGDSYVEDGVTKTYSSDLLRRIVNVADGTGDHDAVTVRQLKSLPAYNYFSYNTGSSRGEDDVETLAKALGWRSLAIGGTALAPGSNSIAIGNDSKASHDSSIALGRASESYGKSGIAVGEGAVVGSKSNSDLGNRAVAIGTSAIATHTNSVAIGADSQTTGTNQVSVGTTFNKRKIVNVADGVNANDAATVGQLNTKADLDAGNLDARNVASWSTKLGIDDYATYKGKVNQNADDIAANTQSITNLYGTDLTSVDVGAWSAKLGVGSVETGNTGLVTGGKVYSAINSVKTELDTKVQQLTQSTNTNLADKATVALDNLTDAGKTVVRDLAQGAVEVKGTGYATVTSSENQNNNVLTYTVNVAANGSVAFGDTGLLTGGVVYNDLLIQATTQGATPSSDFHYLNNDWTTGQNLYALDQALYGALNINKNAWWSALGGTISSAAADSNGNNGDGFVTGKQMYSELRTNNGADFTGSYLSSNNTTGQNLQALSNQIEQINGTGDGSLNSKANADASNVSNNASKWAEALGWGKVVDDSNTTNVDESKLLVTGETMYNELRPTDGNYVTNANTTAQNLTALDTQVKANADNVEKLFDANLTADQKGKWLTTLGNGIVNDGEQQFVNGDTIYHALETVKRETNQALDNKLDKTVFNQYKSDTADRIVEVETEAKKHTTVSTSDGNVVLTQTTNDASLGGGQNYAIALNKNMALESTTYTTNGATSTIDGAGLVVGNTSIKDGAITTNKVTVGNSLTLDSSGKITGVAAGTVSADSTDAVNGSQLYETQQMIGQNASNIQTLNQQINKTYDKVQRVGAGAAALAALRPQDFSPEHPISGAVGLGHYDGKQAIAVGIYYRPTKNFTVGFGASAAGNDDYMMNAGISYRFGGSGSQLRLSQSDINRKVVDLTDQNRALIAQIESSNIREEASAKRLNRVQNELKAAQKKAEVADQKLDMVMKELAALREEIQKMKQR